jgi:hypothetical protein
MSKSPRAALAEIRNAIDDMMEGGSTHITTAGARIDLRELLGKCDLLRHVVPADDEEIVWENECRLVIGRTAGHKIEGDMGLCHEGEEIRVNISSVDYSGKHEIFEKLSDAPVRISIRRVPGGRV